MRTNKFAMDAATLFLKLRNESAMTDELKTDIAGLIDSFAIELLCNVMDQKSQSDFQDRVIDNIQHFNDQQEIKAIEKRR